MSDGLANSKTIDPRNHPVAFTLFVFIFCAVAGTLISPYLGLSQYPPLVFSALIFLFALCCRCPNDMMLTSTLEIKSLRLYWPIPVYLLITPLLLRGYQFDHVDSWLIINMSGVGFFEEILMHGFCLGLMLRTQRIAGKYSYKAVVKATIISSALFGIFHLFMILQKPTEIHWIALRVSTVFFAFFINLGFAGLALRLVAARIGSFSMPTIYLETTIPSYLAAYPSRDLIIAGHQQITHEWWQIARDRFTPFVSEAVLDEIRCGDPSAVIRRLSYIEKIPILALNDDVRDLVDAYDKRLGLVGRARADLPHLAFAVAYEMDYLVTWNCAHIANGEMIRRLLDINAGLNRFTPLIVTPEEILEPLQGQ